MSQGDSQALIHSDRTRNHGYQYHFHPKHHGAGSSRDARWLEALSRDEEFGIFDLADFHDLLDEKGNLYGIRRDTNGELLELGTLDQQVAKFPYARVNESWHGFPLAPLRSVKPPHPEIRLIPKSTLDRMVAQGLLTRNQRDRLSKGKPA